MQKEDVAITVVLTIGMLGILIGLPIASYCDGHRNATQAMEKEVVRLKHAKYIIENEKIVFKWNDVKE